ncbi:transmembrane protein, putative [Medicago truncatula]|uniref:Transmembrane protein, putative n=1 Tax=Medicago truncatula TaxID=3880 RepID=A0A072VFT2_MEDTR|nr:transmembrane protein, putative [Medicago truncatula]
MFKFPSRQSSFIAENQRFSKSQKFSITPFEGLSILISKCAFSSSCIWILIFKPAIARRMMRRWKFTRIHGEYGVQRQCIFIVEFAHMSGRSNKMRVGMSVGIFQNGSPRGFPIRCPIFREFSRPVDSPTPVKIL